MVYTQMNLEHCSTSTMKLLMKIVNGFQFLTIFLRGFICNVGSVPNALVYDGLLEDMITLYRIIFSL